MSIYLKKRLAVKLDVGGSMGRLLFDKADLVEFDYTREIERDLVEIQHKIGTYANKVTRRVVGYKGVAPVKVMPANATEDNLFSCLLRGTGLKGTGDSLQEDITLEGNLFLNPDDVSCRMKGEIFADGNSLVMFDKAFHNAAIKGEEGKVMLMEFEGKGQKADSISWATTEGEDAGELVVFAGGEVLVGGNAVAGLKSFTLNLGGNIVVIPAYEDEHGVYRIIRSKADIYIEIDPLPDSNVRALLDDETEKSIVIKRHKLGTEIQPTAFITMTGLVADYGHEWDNDVMRKKIRFNLSSGGSLSIHVVYAVAS